MMPSKYVSERTIRELTVVVHYSHERRDVCAVAAWRGPVRKQLELCPRKRSFHLD